MEAYKKKAKKKARGRITDFEKLKAYRKAKNLTQEKMAKMLGIAHSGYVCIENGYKEPSLSVLKKISEITGYSAESLIYRRDTDETLLQPEELEAYRALSFSLIKTLCVAPEARRLGRNERDINDMSLKKLRRMLKNVSAKAKKEYESAVSAERKGGSINA